MGLCTSGVSGGLAVGPTPSNPTAAPQLSGVTLSAAGDYATIFVSNRPTPGGPDTNGIFALSPGTVPFVGASVKVQFVLDSANWLAGNWQTLNGVIRNDANTYVNDAFALTNGAALQINPGNVQALYAVRVLLVGVASGTIVVSGSTTPGTVAGVETAILAQQIANAKLLTALALALSDMNGTDYLAGVGGSF